MEIDTAKIITIITLGIGSFLCGLLPIPLSRYNLRQNAILQTILLCFGAGILLATSIVHMLAEVFIFI
jgi:solute carrier family 39 (zinc transporter), member 1/2/3